MDTFDYVVMIIWFVTVTLLLAHIKDDVNKLHIDKEEFVNLTLSNEQLREELITLTINNERCMNAMARHQINLGY